jgi:hypothetical protein
MTFFFDDLAAQRRAAGLVLAVASILEVEATLASVLFVGAPPAVLVASVLAGAATLAIARRTDRSATARRLCGLLLMGQVSLVVGGFSEQSAGLDQVNHAVSEMDRTTQQNTASLADTATAAGQLRSFARELHDIVLRFRLAPARNGPAGARTKAA